MSLLEHCGTEHPSRDKSETPRVMTDGVTALIADELEPARMPQGAYVNLAEMREYKKTQQEEMLREEGKLDKITPVKHRVVRIGRQQRKGLRTITLVLVLPRGKRIKKNFVARAGQAWTQSGVDQLLDEFSENLAQRFPAIEFRLVEAIPSQQFNFIHQDAEKGVDVKKQAAEA
jgi:hypothetical protein